MSMTFYTPNHDLRALAIAVLQARAAAVQAGAYDEVLDQLSLLIEDRGGDLRGTRHDLLQSIAERGKSAKSAAAILRDVGNMHLNTPDAKKREIEAKQLVEQADRIERETREAIAQHEAKRAALAEAGLSNGEIKRAIGEPPVDASLADVARDLRLSAASIRTQITLDARAAAHKAAEVRLRLAGLIK